MSQQKKSPKINKKVITAISVAALLTLLLFLYLAVLPTTYRYDFASMTANCPPKQAFSVSSDGKTLTENATMLVIALRGIDHNSDCFCQLRAIGLLDDSTDFKKDLLNNFDSSTAYRKEYKNSDGAILEVEYTTDNTDTYDQEFGGNTYSISFKGQVVIKELLSPIWSL